MLIAGPPKFTVNILMVLVYGLLIAAVAATFAFGAAVAAVQLF
jgi:hypothetical protein